MRSLLPLLVLVVWSSVGCRDHDKQTVALESPGAVGVSLAEPGSPESALPEPAVPETGRSTELIVARPNETGSDLSPDSAAAVEQVSGIGSYSPAIIEFLKKFDELSAKGFVPSLRSGSTGIGYTLETMLGIAENNSPGGDFMGMELKAFRDDDLRMDDAEKMNLFLKEPTWVDGRSHAERVRNYGYVDDDGRQAMYSTVKIKRNSHGWAFRIARKQRRVYMRFDDEDVAFWTFDTLKKRLVEKHSEAVFVAAHARGAGKQEEFHYYSVTWCRDPSLDAFVDLIEAGDVMLELRMHTKASGSVRNHGSAFRIKQNKIPILYGNVDQLRPVDVQ